MPPGVRQDTLDEPGTGLAGARLNGRTRVTRKEAASQAPGAQGASTDAGRTLEQCLRHELRARHDESPLMPTVRCEQVHRQCRPCADKTNSLPGKELACTDQCNPAIDAQTPDINIGIGDACGATSRAREAGYRRSSSLRRRTQPAIKIRTSDAAHEDAPPGVGLPHQPPQARIELSRREVGCDTAPAQTPPLCPGPFESAVPGIE